MWHHYIFDLKVKNLPVLSTVLIMIIRIKKIFVLRKFLSSLICMLIINVTIFFTDDGDVKSVKDITDNTDTKTNNTT